jgi:peroxiredoxin Q/BCP
MPKIPARGELAPDFSLPDSTGIAQRLSDLTSEGAVVLLFYRGWWWPFCHRQLADYRDHYAEISAAGASVVAVSVDAAVESEALRTQLSLPFPILCDIERTVIREWGLLNARERGGIAKPSVFVVAPDLRTQYAAVDTVAHRVAASEILSGLNTRTDDAHVQRKTYVPLPGDWIRAIRNNFRKR